MQTKYSREELRLATTYCHLLSALADALEHVPALPESRAKLEAYAKFSRRAANATANDMRLLRDASFQTAEDVEAMCERWGFVDAAETRG